ncbi:MAG: UDP-N-acetylmuramate dehydrogenase [Chloroflexi bacterium]|nr:MAG: UDP-N-acetylmuramate dehydrogenase [Chloroflexota bacterium]
MGPAKRTRRESPRASWRAPCQAPASRPTSPKSGRRSRSSSNRVIWSSSWARAISGRCPISWRNKSNLAWLSGLDHAAPDRPLDKLTSFNIGGPADYFVETAEPGPLVSGCWQREIPYLLLGAGTNLLVGDGGVEGLVIRDVNRGFKQDGDRVFGGAGLKMMRLARLAADHDLTGLEFAIGIPGTVGGAVYQNAGCWGSEVKDVLAGAEGDGVHWQPADLGLGYRTSAFREGALRGHLIAGAWFQLRPGDGHASREQMATWTAERKQTQPVATKNCGSVFKNPSGDSAGRLVEAAGLKGAREGAALISTKHANFIENAGGATAADVRKLIERAREAVLKQFGVALETEVELVGREKPRS